MKIKNLFLAFLGLVAVYPVSAQLRQQFRSEPAGVWFVQLPTAKERYTNLDVQVTQKALLGEKVSQATEKISAAANLLGGVVQDNTGTFSDKKEPLRKYQIIPNVFPSEGTLYLEVLFYDEHIAHNMNLPARYFDGIGTGVKVEYNLYKMPEKKLILSEGPFWVYGEGGKGAGPFQTYEEIYKDRVRIAGGWATEQVKNKYAIEYKYTPFNAYVVRNLDGEDAKKAEEAQKKLVSLANRFRSQGHKEEYKKEVNECIAIWEELLKQYVPDARRGKDAAINDNNVWTLHYNLAVAYYLLGNKAKGSEYADKGAAITKIQWEDIKNSKGEVIGKKKIGIQHGTEDLFHVLKGRFEAFYAGIAAHNPTFVAMLTNSDNLFNTSRKARNIATNVFISNVMGLEVPVEIISNNFEKMPKGYSGAVNQDGNEVVTFTVKKNPLAFMQKHKTYIAKIQRVDETVKTKQTYNAFLSPSYTTYDFSYQTKERFWGLPARIGFNKVKSIPKQNSLGGTSIIFDYNGDIKFSNYKFSDKGMFINIKSIRVTERDALKLNKIDSRITLKDFTEISTIDNTITDIERNREVGFFSAFTYRVIKKTDYPTTEISNNTKNQKLNMATDTKIESKDDNGNWTKMKVGKLEVSRSIVY